MKKIFQLFCMVYILTSCSGDNEATIYNDKFKTVTLKNVTTTDPVLKDLYVTMINSQSYLNYGRARAAFDAKMGNAIPQSELATEDLMLRWIANNISKTGFTSYTGAENEHKNVLALNSISLQVNKNFYDYLVGTASGSLIPILQEIQTPPVSAFSCKPCERAHINCTNAAMSAYDKALKNISLAFREGEIGGNKWSAAQDNAVKNYMYATRKCDMTFESCCSGGGL